MGGGRAGGGRGGGGGGAPGGGPAGAGVTPGPVAGTTIPELRDQLDTARQTERDAAYVLAESERFGRPIGEQRAALGEATREVARTQDVLRAALRAREARNV